MKISKVQVEDFLTIGKARYSLDSQGLVLIQGVNKDNPSAISNGAGKSSLVDALCWCLYGETARGESTSKVIRDGAKKAMVIATFQDEDGTTYTVERERTKAKMALRLLKADSPDGRAEPTENEITLGTAALTQARIIELLGCSAEVFRAGVYLGQEQMPDLPRMTDKRLKELIEEAAGLSVIEACYERARTRRDEVLTRHGTVVAAQAANKGHIESGDHMVSQAESDVKEWDEQHAKRVEEALRVLVDARAEEVRLKAIADGLHPGAVTASHRLDAINAEMAGFNKAKEVVGLAQKQVLAAEREVAAAETDARAKIAKRREAEAHHAQALSGERCDACGQDIPEERRSAHVHDAAEALAAARRDALQAAERVKAARQQAAEKRAQAALCERAVPDVSALQAEAETLRDQLSAYDRARQAYRDAGDATLKAETTHTGLMLQTNPCKPALERAIKHVANLREEALRLHEQHAELEAELEVAKGVVAVFGPSGVRAEILDQVTPYLNARTAAYLDHLSDGTLKALWTTIVRDAKGNPREKFSIEVTHPAGEGFAVLSGGEKRKVRLATALALQDLVASRATKPMDLFIADEIDDALDEAGLERLMGVLGEKAREKGTVLVISHNSLTDWIPNTWVVTKAGGVATLETT